MTRIVILNDTRNSNKEKFQNDDGFSAYIETENNKILFDAGPTNKFIDNAKILEIDLNKIDTAILSHGHFDHGDGFKYYNQKVKFISHPNCILKRWWRDDYSHYSGIQLSKEELENKYDVEFTKEPYKVSDDIYYLGEIDRKREVIINKWVLEDGTNDEVLDDSGIVINTKQGLIVIAGCSHSGICNIVEQAKRVTNNNKVRVVLGGFHLRKLNEEVDRTIEYMRNNVDEVILAHCTSDEVCNKFIEELNEKIKISITEVGKCYIY